MFLRYEACIYLPRFPCFKREKERGGRTAETTKDWCTRLHYVVINIAVASFPIERKKGSKFIMHNAIRNMNKLFAVEQMNGRKLSMSTQAYQSRRRIKWLCLVFPHTHVDFERIMKLRLIEFATQMENLMFNLSGQNTFTQHQICIRFKLVEAFEFNQRKRTESFNLIPKEKLEAFLVHDSWNFDILSHLLLKQFVDTLLVWLLNSDKTFVLQPIHLSTFWLSSRWKRQLSRPQLFFFLLFLLNLHRYRTCFERKSPLAGPHRY